MNELILRSEVNERILKALAQFDTSFVHKEELILHKMWNVYFLLSNITSEKLFDYKILSYLSFLTASNHYTRNSAKCRWATKMINQWFGRTFRYEDLQRIYQKIGCGCIQTTGMEFIEKGFDMNVLFSESEVTK